MRKVQKWNKNNFRVYTYCLYYQERCKLLLIFLTFKFDQQTLNFKIFYQLSTLNF